MRFRLTPALVVGCMANGVLRKSVDENRGATMEHLCPTHMHPILGQVVDGTRPPGCQSAGCRTLGKCLCECKQCKKECRPPPFKLEAELAPDVSNRFDTEE